MNFSEVTMERCDLCGKLYEPYGKPHKCKGTIEIDCRKCVNSTGHSCKAYGTENPDIAVEKCAKDGFKNYMF